MIWLSKNHLLCYYSGVMSESQCKRNPDKINFQRIETSHKKLTPTVLSSLGGPNDDWMADWQVDYNYSCVARQPRTGREIMNLNHFNTNCSSIMLQFSAEKAKKMDTKPYLAGCWMWKCGQHRIKPAGSWRWVMYTLIRTSGLTVSCVSPIFVLKTVLICVL